MLLACPFSANIGRATALRLQRGCHADMAQLLVEPAIYTKRPLSSVIDQDGVGGLFACACVQASDSRSLKSASGWCAAAALRSCSVNPKLEVVTVQDPSEPRCRRQNHSISARRAGGNDVDRRLHDYKGREVGRRTPSQRQFSAYLSSTP